MIIFKILIFLIYYCSNNFLQICVAKSGMDQIITDRFIPTPKINVEQNALDLGFNKRIEFPEQNIVKYFKIINDTEKQDFWYFSRKCAKENGVLYMPEDPSMAQVQFNPSLFSQVSTGKVLAFQCDIMIILMFIFFKMAT